MSNTIFGHDFTNLLYVVFGVIICLMLLWRVDTMYESREFGVFFPTSEQRALYKARNEARRDWLDLKDAMSMAERENMGDEVLSRLTEAASNAYDTLGDLDEAVEAERARVANFSKYEKLADKWL